MLVPLLGTCSIFYFTTVRYFVYCHFCRGYYWCVGCISRDKAICILSSCCVSRCYSCTSMCRALVCRWACSIWVRYLELKITWIYRPNEWRCIWNAIDFSLVRTRARYLSWSPPKVVGAHCLFLLTWQWSRRIESRVGSPSIFVSSSYSKCDCCWVLRGKTVQCVVIIVKVWVCGYANTSTELST